MGWHRRTGGARPSGLSLDNCIPSCPNDLRQMRPFLWWMPSRLRREPNSVHGWNVGPDPVTWGDSSPWHLNMLTSRTALCPCRHSAQFSARYPRVLTAPNTDRQSAVFGAVIAIAHKQTVWYSRKSSLPYNSSHSLDLSLESATS